MSTLKSDVREKKQNIAQFLSWCGPILLALAAYIFCFQFSALLDFPNLLARATIMGNCLWGQSHPQCAEFVVKIQPIPYIASDLLLVLLLKLFPAWWAEQIALYLLLVLLLTGWYRLFVAVHRRPNQAFIAGCLLLFTNFYYAGFYPFLLSIALMLWWLSFWWERREESTFGFEAASAALLALVFEIHLAGFFSIIAVVACFELSQFLGAIGVSGKIKSLKNSLRHWPAGVVTVGLFVMQQAYTSSGSSSPGSNRWDNEGGLVHWWVVKISRMFYPIINHQKYVDLLIVAFMVVVLLVSIDKNKLAGLCKSFWAWMALAFVGFYIFTKDMYLGAIDVDIRFMMFAYVAFFLAIGQVVKSSKIAVSACAVLLAITFCRNVFYKSEMNQVLAPFSQALDHIPSGKKLIEFNAVTSFPQGPRSRVNPFSHFAAYYILREGASVENLFNCLQNKNISYFCYRLPPANPNDFAAQFGGLSKMSPTEVLAKTKNVDYVLVHESQHELVDQSFNSEHFKQVFNSGNVYLFQVLAG